MIERPIGLVLGAGASIDFKFPSGWQLRRRICEQLAGSSPAMTCLEQCGFKDAECGRFAQALAGSGSMSVDAFLGGRQDLVEIGKAAIAAVLIPYENPVNEAGDAPSWLDYLFQRMSASRNNWRSNQLSIVTFNYDRVVEHYFHKSLSNHLGLSVDDAAQLFAAAVRVVHVHGQLGELTYDQRKDGRAFSPELAPGAVKVSAAGIRIIHEMALNEQTFVDARALIEDAQEVVFAGFGYDETNLKRLLGPQALLTKKRALGSSIGMEHYECMVAQQRGGDTLALDEESKNLSEFLRRNNILGHVTRQR